MGLGTQVRLSRLFSNPSGRLFGVAVDHFVSYGDARLSGLDDLPAAIARSMAGHPDTMTMMAGTAKNCWAPYVGQAALIVQSAAFTPDDRVALLMSTPEDALRLGADAIAVAIPVRGPSEGDYLRWLTDTVRAAAPFELPVVAHIYPRVYTDGPRIVVTPEEIAWAVRCGIETGVDVIKVGYPGDPAAFTEIVHSCPVPVVIAGGPKAETLQDALAFTAEAIGCGARGAVVGRNIWGVDDVEGAAGAYRSVIHDDVAPDEAMGQA